MVSKKADAHKLFNLTVANDGQLPIKMYTELDITFLGLKVPNVGMLVIENPSQVLDKKHQSKVPGIGRLESSLAILQLCLSRNMGHQDLTLLHVWKELILYFSPNFVSTTIQTQVKVMDWECLPKLSPSNLNK